MKLFIENDIIIKKPTCQLRLEFVNSVFLRFRIDHSWKRGSGILFVQRYALPEHQMNTVLNAIYLAVRGEVLLRVSPDDFGVIFYLEEKFLNIA